MDLGCISGLGQLTDCWITLGSIFPERGSRAAADGVVWWEKKHSIMGSYGENMLLVCNQNKTIQSSLQVWQVILESLVGRSLAVLDVIALTRNYLTVCLIKNYFPPQFVSMLIFACSARLSTSVLLPRWRQSEFLFAHPHLQHRGFIVFHNF